MTHRSEPGMCTCAVPPWSTLGAECRRWGVPWGVYRVCTGYVQGMYTGIYRFTAVNCRFMLFMPFYAVYAVTDMQFMTLLTLTPH